MGVEPGQGYVLEAEPNKRCQKRGSPIKGGRERT